MTKILPCPFCNSEAKTISTSKVFNNTTFSYWGVYCSNEHHSIECQLIVDGYASEDAAIYCWNTRFGYPLNDTARQEKSCCGDFEP